MSSSTTPPIILPTDLKFYYSGGYYNSEPNLSLGGETSSFQLVSGTLNGLFDRVDTTEAELGDTEFRCIYLRNTSQTRKLLGTKIWIETGTASADTAIAISLGSSGINGIEPTIPDEGLEPPMNFFEIPLQAPDEPNIGDLYPGDHIALWVRWYVKTGTQTIGDDFAVIRIDGEREPESITTPLPPDEGEPPPTTGCPSGSKWSPTEARCVDDSTVIICPNGYTYNSTTQRCVPPTTPPPSVALLKFADFGDSYPNSDTEDVFALLQRQLNTTAGSQDISFLLHTGDATHIDGDNQVFIDYCQEYLGGMFPNHIAPALGNHDDGEDGSSGDGQDLIDAFPLMGSDGYYAFTRRNIRVIVMNGQTSYSSGSAQHSFVVQQLQQAAADPAIKWKIVTYHKPTLVSACYYGPQTDLRNLYHPLFDQYKVDLIFSGHTHVYFRSKPVKHDSANPGTPIIVSDQAAGNYINLDARIFLQVSTGGRSNHNTFDGDPEAYVGARHEPPPFGAMICTLQDNGNQLHCQFMTTSNQVLDDFTLSKPGATPPPPGGGAVCPQGFHWDETQGRCIISPQQCPTLYRWEPAQNKCVAISGEPPPPEQPVDPLAGVDWYYDSTTTQNTPQTINVGSYDTTEGIAIPHNGEGVSNLVISGGYFNVQSGTGGGVSGIHFDYSKKARFSADDKPGFNTVISFTFVYEGQTSISVYDGNHKATGLTSSTNRIFGGFGFNIIGPRETTPNYLTQQSNSQVKYWVDTADPDFSTGAYGETVTSYYPGGREIEHGKTYKVCATIRNNRITHTVVQNAWLDFGDGDGWQKIQTDRTWSSSNWNPGSVPEGYDDTTQINTGPAAIQRHNIYLRNNCTEDPRIPLKLKDVKIGTLPYLSDVNNPPPPGNGGGGGGTGGTLDSNGIRWYMATGQQGVINQTRNEASDDRWSGNVSDVAQYGYECTMYLTVGSIDSGGHFAMKMWGPNHSGDCGHTEGGDCCCWYDLGVRANGDIQQEIERPHPSNDSFNKGKVLQNMGRGLDGETTGLKWLIYPVIPGGSADEGGIKIKMWVDTDGLLNGKPQNKWRLAMDLVDTGDILGDYPNPDYEHDLEVRNSDSSGQSTYAGGLHWRKIQAGDTDQSGGGGGGGGGNPPPPPGGGGTIPPGVAFKFNVAGDFRAGSDAEATAANLVATPQPDVIFMVGDYAIGDASAQEWCDEIMAPVANSGIPIWGCLGNHDNDDYLDTNFFENTSWSWMVKFGNIAFIGANTISENVSQTQTLCATAQADSTVNRIVIFMHESVFKQTGGGTSGSDTTIAFHNMFKTFSKLKLVIAGHSHNYTRFAAYEGIVYVINEDGGQQPDDDTGCMKCSVDAQGSITCTMNPNTGGTLDSFTIGADGTLPGGGTLLPPTMPGETPPPYPPVVVRIGPDEDYDAKFRERKKE